MNRLQVMLTALVLALLAGFGSTAHAQPTGAPPMDPRMMSGISRPDPQVPGGTVTVRCLLGSFSEPAVGFDVELTLTGKDGKTETRTAKTVDQGRATFSGLEAFAGGTAIAKVSFDGEVQASRPIQILPAVGSRVMLVKGAKPNAGPPMMGPPAGAPPMGPPVAPGAANPHGAAGAPHGDVPLPGTAFPLRERPKGTVVVGTLDLSKGEPVKNIDVVLTITPPEGKPVERTLTSDAMGRAVFDNILPPTVPEGSKMVASATIEGQELKSEAFEMGETALAVVLAKGRDPAAAAAPAPAAPRGPAPLPGPRSRDDIPAGTVHVQVLDGKDRPVAEQTVQVVRSDVTGAKTQVTGVTAANGVAIVPDVEVRPDSLYFVGVAYDGGPYRSSFFRLDPDRGASVAVRVYPVTSDPSKVKSAVQFELRGRENDLVQVVQLYEIFVDGDAAYWPGEPMKLEGAEGAHGLVVLRGSEQWLEEKEKAPFALVPEPLPPRQVARLSVGYLLDHGGDVDLSWKPPFAVQEASVVLPKEFTLVEPAGVAAKPLPQSDDVSVYGLGAKPLGTTVEVEVEGLPTRPRVFRWIGIGVGLTLVLVAGIAIATRPRGGLTQTLEARKQALFAELDRVVEAGDEAERARILTALDRVYRELEALGGSSSKGATGQPSKKG